MQSIIAQKRSMLLTAKFIWHQWQINEIKVWSINEKQVWSIGGIP
jgi:hypothetical protein